MNYIPSLDDFGDEPVPLDKLARRTRSSPPIRPAVLKPLGEEERFRLLQGHCARRGKRHEFVVETRFGLKCLWCGLPKVTVIEEIEA